MRATCTRVVLGCLLVGLLALPALASDRLRVQEEDAYSALKQNLVQRVEAGQISEEAMGHFLEALRRSSQEFAELDAKDADAPAQRVRTLMAELKMPVPKNENDSLVHAAVRWTVELNAPDADRLRRTSDRR